MKPQLRNNQWPVILLLFVPVYLVVFSQHTSYAQDGPVMLGKQLFDTKCTPCHTIGGGRKVGPDLRGVTGTRSKTWLFSFISDPEKMFSENDPEATDLLKEYQLKMPNMGLSPDDVNAVISYLETEGKTATKAKVEPAGKTSAEVQTSVADGVRGKQFFTGEAAFKNSGPPCMACHSVAGIKYLGGGNLGPDLTNTYASLGSGIVSMLENVPFPTMKPIFDTHPLTPQEAQDLAAFFREIASGQPANHTALVVAISLIPFVMLMIIVHVLWRKRLVSVRKAMVVRAERENSSR